MYAGGEGGGWGEVGVKAPPVGEREEGFHVWSVEVVGGVGVLGLVHIAACQCTNLPMHC